MRAFPDLLDYVYGLPSFRFTVEAAVPLHVLADRMGAPALKKAAERFMKGALTCESPPRTFYEDAQVLCDETALDLVTKWYAQAVYDYEWWDPQPEKLFQITDASFWIKIVQAMHHEKDKNLKYKVEYEYATSTFIFNIIKHCPNMTPEQFALLIKNTYQV